MEANQNPPSQENFHLHNEETEDKKKNQEEEEEVMTDQFSVEILEELRSCIRQRTFCKSENPVVLLVPKSNKMVLPNPVHLPDLLARDLFFRKRKLMSDLAKKNLSLGKLKRSFKKVKRLAHQVNVPIDHGYPWKLLARKLSLLVGGLSLLERKIKRVADMVDCLNRPDLAKRNLSFSSLEQDRLNCREVMYHLAKWNLSLQELSSQELSSWELSRLVDLISFCLGYGTLISRLIDLEKRSQELFLSIMGCYNMEKQIAHKDPPADLEKRKLMHWIRHTESISCLEQLDIGRLNMSARYYKEIAELYEQEQNLEQTIVYYERAADLFQSECHTSANQCRQKIALEQYPKAIEIYEDIARQSLNNNLLKYGVKGHLLNAAYASYVRVMLWQSIMHWSDIRSSIQPSQEHGNTDKPQLK